MKVEDAALAAKSEKWLFTEQELKRTPSVQASYSSEREWTERMKGCDFIFKIGMKLRLLQSTIATACTFLHRFYMRFSLREYHYYDIGATSLFLATKCDENVKSLRSIVVECCKTAQKNEQLVVDEQSKEYWRWRDVLLYNEELLLEALCFDLVISHPYNDLRQYWKRLGGGNELRKCAWAFVNDTYRTRIVLMYKTPVIAAAALYFGSVFTDTPLTEVSGEPWWRTLNVDLTQCEEVIQIMIELFETAPNLVNNGIDFKEQAKKGGEVVKLLDVAKETASDVNGNSAKRVAESAAEEPQPSVKRAKAEQTPELAVEEGELKE